MEMKMIRVVAVEPDSIGQELEIEAGDELLAVNGMAVRDLVDFQVSERLEELELEVRKADGEVWVLELEKDAEDDLGLVFEHPEPAQCGNNCVFCFVHQLPKGMRRSLYVKDEDYRFSYLYGAYVTLTNISEEEILRIIEQKLSPLYVSVHSVDEALRARMLGRSGPPILGLLRRLVEAGIEIHTQIVLCPGYNDGPRLLQTIDELYGLHPGVRTLAVVPVGLTGFRDRLPALRVPTAEEAAGILEQIHGRQGQFLAAAGSRFVFGADELYLRAGVDFPSLEAYEALAQIENGVGLVAQFRHEARQVLDLAVPLRIPEVSTFTGDSFHGELEGFLARLSEAIGVPLHLYRVSNAFFGGQVSVTGLLTGKDVIARLKGQNLGKVLLVPDVVLRDGQEVFLDDLSLEDLRRQLDVEVMVVRSAALGIYEALEELEMLSGGED